MMRNAKLTLMTLLTVAFWCRGVQAWEDNNDFWEGFDEDEPPYQHDWTSIPDLINKKNVTFWFNMTH